MEDKRFRQMQQNLEKMKNSFNSIGTINYIEPQNVNKRSRRAVEKKINKIKHPKISKLVREEQIIVVITIIIVFITFVFSTSIFAKTISENSQENTDVLEKNEFDENNNKEEFLVENNENAIQLEEILFENVSILKSKEYAEEIRAIEYEKTYLEDPYLPEGEEVVVQPGINGTEQVKVIKSYENNELVSENILEAIPMEPFVSEKIKKGTSKFLANNKVHIGDVMYVTENVKLLTNVNEFSQEICEIPKSIDVKLIELKDEKWCKIECENLEGYVECKYLTSAKVTPGIVEANRIQRIKLSLTENIELNHSTTLTLEDYKKMLLNNSEDKNNIISDNAEVFYNVDKAYNINGVFLASIAIHESAWGTSTISKDKKNLFGYGAYDSSPYQSSFCFESYAEGIDLLAKVMVKYYINKEGTLIYNDEIAKGSYYNEPTISGVNIRYASDENWHDKVYSYMKKLYNRL